MALPTPSRCNLRALVRAVTASALLALALPGRTQATATIESVRPSLIPQPAAVQWFDGELRLSRRTPLQIEGDRERVRPVAEYLRDLLRRSGGPVLYIAPRGVSETAAPSIRLRLDGAADIPTEGYRLQVTVDGITVIAHEPAGLFYGIVTLWQLLIPSADPDSPLLPLLRIEDAPRFAWRGLMLDVARHFRSVDEVKALIEQMALHKLNVLQLHLTDDQGWRLQIQRYPRLTQIGGCRIPAGAAGHQAGMTNRYCGYYSQDDIRDLVRYASERHVMLVPEIEMPGHAQAAIAAYPELGVRDVFDSPPAVSPAWGVHTYLYNVEDSTFTFLENVLGEVLELFPSPYIHIGGDEAAKDQWQVSASVQARMRALDVRDEFGLQSWFITRIEQFLSARGRRLIGWDEIIEGGLPPRATVMSWRGLAGAIAAVGQGHDVVLAPAPDLYLDHIQSRLEDETSGRLGVIGLLDVYRFQPMPEAFTVAQQAHVLGAQGNLWSEHLRVNKSMQQAAFPRAAALAEVLWSPATTRDEHGFLVRLAQHMPRYRRLGFAASDSAFALDVALDSDDDGGVRLTLVNSSNFGETRYAVAPDSVSAHSLLYTAPLVLMPPQTVSANVFFQGEALARPRTIALPTVDAASQRSSSALETCSEGLVLRLEDDAPADGVGGDRPRAVFNTDIFSPCWKYRNARLDARRRIVVRVGQLPYNFQLWHDSDRVRVWPKAGPDGSLQVLLDDCEAPPLVELPLTPALGHDGLTELSAMLPALRGRHDLCLRFATGSNDPLWVIDQVALRAD